MNLKDMNEQGNSIQANVDTSQIGKCDSSQAPQEKPVKVIVLCTNESGELDFHSCEQFVTDEQLQNGDHYQLAKENAAWCGYSEPMIAFDSKDPAAAQLASLAAWL